MRPENHPDLKAWLESPRLKAAVKAYLPNDVVPMTGKRGGGFIFDTNAIHKGTRPAQKSTSHDSAVAETRRDNLISTQARCPGRAPAPCSSSSTWRLTRSRLCGTSASEGPAGPPEKIKYRRERTSATASSTARSSRRNVHNQFILFPVVGASAVNTRRGSVSPPAPRASCPKHQGRRHR